jgi:very-short-patch-repair endonuclease
MKMYDLHENLVNVDVRQSSFPLKAKSKSNLQGQVGQYLQDKFPRQVILEEFTIPGSRLSVDFFMPGMKPPVVIEIQGIAHDQYTPFFHKDRASGKYAGQITRDRQKNQWCQTNGYELIEIRTPEDMKELDNV